MWMLFLFLLMTGSVHAADCSTDAWAETVGAAEASNDAAYYGSCSLKITADGNANFLQGAAFVEDQTPGSVSPPVMSYAARFYLRADDISMTESPSELVVFRGWLDNNQLAFQVAFAICDGVEVVYLSAGTARSDNVPLQPGWNEITVFWDAAGSMRIRVLGSGDQTVDSAITSSPLTRVQLGVPTGTLELFTGALYFDEFASTRGSDPGPRVNVCSFPNVVLNDYVFNSDSPKLCSAESIEMKGVEFTPGEYELKAKTISIAAPFVIRSGSEVKLVSF